MILIVEDQGKYRDYMEDRTSHERKIFEDFDYYSIFDGHGGAEVASYLKVNMKLCVKQMLQSHLDKAEKIDLSLIGTILFESFQMVCQNLPSVISTNTGSTAIVILKRKDKLWVANCGDSRALMNIGSSNFMQLTFDHKPERSDEYARIIASGGFVGRAYRGDVLRVNGILGVSRSIGDLKLYPHVSWVPEIHEYTITETNNFIIMATDGLWDSVSNKEAIEMVYSGLIEDNYKGVIRTLIATARENGSTDNISILIVTL
jgi:serine/threonine protein phosphatase PrpC